MLDGVHGFLLAYGVVDLLDLPAGGVECDVQRWLLPCLGFLFLPFTTMVYAWLMQGVGGIQGIDWLWLGLALFSDVATIASAGYANRNRIPGATTPTPTAPPPSGPAQ